jgi:putative oxidoreductase
MMCSHTSKCCPQFAPIGLLALRIAVAAVFVYMGYNKLFVNTGMTIQMFGGLGFPAPSFWAYFVGLAEFVGGLMVLLGVFTRVAASWLAVTMAVALLAVHVKGPYTAALLPIMMLGATLALAGVGAGRYRLVQMECPCPKCRAACKNDCADGKCGNTMDTKMMGGCCGPDGKCKCGDKMMQKDEGMKQ